MREAKQINGRCPYLFYLKEEKVYYIKEADSILATDSTLESIFTLIKYPLQKDASWDYILGFPIVVGEKEYVNTNAGNFECFPLSIYDLDGNIGGKMWLAKNVGIVKMTAAGSRRVLHSYELK